MLVATLTALVLLLGVSGGKDQLEQTQKIVEQYVDDDDRAERANATLEKMHAELDAFDLRIVEARQRVLDLDQDYDATADDYRALFDDIDRIWIELEGKLIDWRFEFRDDVTREEWTKIYADLAEHREARMWN